MANAAVEDGTQGAGHVQVHVASTRAGLAARRDKCRARAAHRSVAR